MPDRHLRPDETAERRTVSETLRRRLRLGLLVATLTAALAYFAREISRGLDSVRAWPSLGLGLALAVAATLVAIWMIVETWRVSLRQAAPAAAGIDRTDAFAIVSVTSFAKYLPGKVWTISLQTGWLAERGIAPTAVLAAVVCNVLTSLSVELGFGAVLIAWRLSGDAGVAAGVAALVIAAHALTAVKGHGLVRRGAALASRIARRPVELADLSARSIAMMQVGYAVMCLATGLAAVFTARALDLKVDGVPALELTLAVPFANALGFLALFTPGGLGVREGALYALLRGTGQEPLAVLVPIWTRLITMTLEAAAFAAGLAIIRLRRR
jgi:hypothetical protein